MKQLIYDDMGKYPDVSGGNSGTDLVSPVNLPADKRPRERLFMFGPSSLSDLDLLAIILNTGIKGRSVYHVAEELLAWIDRMNSIPTAEDLSLLAGIGRAKACSITAMLEFGRRRWGPVDVRIREPEDAYQAIRHYADRKQERFICLSLNGAHELIAARVVTVGLVNKTIVHPREVFADPLLDRACAVVVAHNHPSGQLTPSAEDDEITLRLQSAADILGIRLLDHLIISEKGFFSYMKSQRLSD